MKILIVSPYPVFPTVFGGQVRIFQIAKNLSKLGNDVTILASHTGKIKSESMEVDGIKIRNFRSVVQDVTMFLHDKIGTPLIISYPFHRFFSSRFRHLFNGEYDVVEFEQPFLASWMRLVAPNTLKIYSSQNVEVDFDISEYHKSLLYPFYRKLLSDCEAEALRLSDHVIAVSKEDKDRLTKIYRTSPNKISVIENGFEPLKKKIDRTKLRKKIGIKPEAKVAVFIGSKTLPNLNCVRDIIKEIAPKNKSVVFLLIGNSSVPSDKNYSNIISLGLVDKPDDYLQAGDVGLLPVYSGSGTNIKLLNYLKLGLSVISTEFGIRGYQDFKKYVTLSSIDEFPDRITKVRKYKIPKELLEKYTWENLVKKLDFKYKELYYEYS